MYRSIIVPLDGTAFGERALPVALAAARRAGAELHLMHAHMPGQPDVPLHAREQSYLNDLIRQIKPTWNGHIDGSLIAEPVADALCDYAAAVRADLIVMSTHARSGLLHLWMGCVTDAVVRHSPVPVLLLGPASHPPAQADAIALTRILIPLDGSALAERILPHAAALGRLMGSELVLLQAVEPPPIESVGNEEQGLAGIEQRASIYLNDIAARLRAADLSVQTDLVVAVSDAAAAIIEYASANQLDLIAMETHGRHGLGRVFQGGNTYKVVHSAPMPVLLHCPAVASR